MAPRLLSCFRRSSSEPNHEEKETAGSTTTEEERGPGPVVVELFSSQGCATSTEAEMVFSRLGRGDFNLDVPLVLLAYHVDYWDYNGWKDPFGSSQWTVRQKAYVEALSLDTMFTPQIVIQGRAQCVANEPEEILSCIASAPRFPATSFQATFQKPTPDSLQVSLTGTLSTKVDDQGANLMVALYECSLVTDCVDGANKGRVLANDYVVRRLEKLCSVHDISPKKSISGTLNFPLWEGFNAAKCGVSVFVESPSHLIYFFSSSSSVFMIDD
ncbi:hypothetical protein Sango_1317600 [Sesamum angolense]|uniref:Uncharacterized protein n=1 Tax=Sesamum angolense TaxID=2727404 RepID=A0AAE2BUP9_9LAMI|nr:hypothetical protein Sango_1317600 [Sesamum angolense]